MPQPSQRCPSDWRRLPAPLHRALPIHLNPRATRQAATPIPGSAHRARTLSGGTKTTRSASRQPDGNDCVLPGMRGTDRGPSSASADDFRRWQRIGPFVERDGASAQAIRSFGGCRFPSDFFRGSAAGSRESWTSHHIYRRHCRPPPSARACRRRRGGARPCGHHARVSRCRECRTPRVGHRYLRQLYEKDGQGCRLLLRPLWRSRRQDGGNVHGACRCRSKPRRVNPARGAENNHIPGAAAGYVPGSAGTGSQQRLIHSAAPLSQQAWLPLVQLSR